MIPLRRSCTYFCPRLSTYNWLKKNSFAASRQNPSLAIGGKQSYEQADKNLAVRRGSHESSAMWKVRRNRFCYNEHVCKPINNFPSCIIPIFHAKDKCNSTSRLVLKRQNVFMFNVVSGLSRPLSLENFYQYCWWIPLAERRNQQKFVFMHDVINKRAFSIFWTFIPQLIIETTIFSLQNYTKISNPYTRTENTSQIMYPVFAFNTEFTW